MEEQAKKRKFVVCQTKALVQPERMKEGEKEIKSQT